MVNRKASGDDKMPTDLFKKAPEAIRKRAWILINVIFAGHYVCSEELLKARVVLLCKDHGNPMLLSHYGPIALCNSFYQLINTIITSRIRGLTERYTILESSTGIARENGSENRFLSRVRSAAKRECEP